METDSSPRQSESRTYRSALRAQQADRTRELIADAARAAFLESGWSGTSVRSVAVAAGVSEATVYAIYGSKGGLVRSLADSVDSAADLPRLLNALRKAQGNPARQLAACVAFDRRLFEANGAMLRTLAEGRRQNPDLAAFFIEGARRGDEGRGEVFRHWPGHVWRDGVTVQQALDIYALLVSFPTYELATVERGWTATRLEKWWNRTLVEQLLA